MLEKAINFVTEQVNDLKQDNVLYALVLVLIVTFLIALIMSGGRGENSKIAKAVKKQDLTLLPARVASQFKKATKSHVAVADAVPFDSAVTIPLSTAGCKRAPVFMKWSVLLVCALAVITLNTVDVLEAIWGAALLFVVGVVLVLLISQASHGAQKKAAKTYYKLVDFLQTKVGAEEEVDEPVVQEPAPVSYQPPVYESNEQQVEPEVVEPEVEPAPFVFPIAEEPVVVQEQEEEEEDINAAIMREVEEEKARKAAEEQERLEREAQEKAAEEQAQREREQAQLEEERRQEEEAARARELEQQKAREEAARAREEAARARAEAEAKARAEEEAKAAAAKSTASGSAEDVIERINKIQREGAPLATMKEVALALQAERRKPENATPEQQKKLNEALATLLKCMSSNR